MEWKSKLFSELFVFQKKSKIKAGDKLNLGKYPFFTSSNELKYFLDEYNYQGPALIMGSGGNPSIHYADKKFSTSTDCFTVYPVSLKIIDTNFAFYYLSGNIQILENGFKGAGLKHISKDYISNIQIPLPPLPTQQHIAAILDQADALRKKDQQLITKYDALLQSIFYEMFGDPVKNEKGWEIETLGYMIDFLTSGSRGWAKHYNKTGDLFLRINNIGKNNLMLNDVIFVTTPKGAEAERTRVKPNDILMSITADLGRTAVIPSGFPIAYINQHLAIIRLKVKYNAFFISQYISTDGGYSQLMKSNKGGVKAGLNFDDIKSLKIPLPPINLQNQFATIAQNIQMQKEKVKLQMQQSQLLFEGLLQKAFKGELVNLTGFKNL